MAASMRHDWDLAEIEALLELPLVDLLWRAQQVHRDAHPDGYHVQLASLLSVKTRRLRRGLRLLPAVDASQQ